MLKEGTVIGERYEVVGRIGSGGMADVYKAKDTKLNRFVAVKVMKPEFANDSSFISKFRREAQAAAGLANPNIVNVYDVGEDQGIYFIVMELVEGITLKEYIAKKGKLSVREATSIAIQVCMGLAAAHNQKIVHRDVKPQNIIISTDGKVKVTDFGIARAASSNTISANAMGSVHYSSPEQVRGGYSDARADIYSVGITLYEMVTGRVPFDGETTVAIAIKHLQDEMEPPTKFTPDLPVSLEQIIYKCTQKSVDRRYQSMDDVIADLKRSLMEPDGQFVQLTPLSDHAQTVMITEDDQAKIKAAKTPAAPPKKKEKAAPPEKKTYTSTEAARKGYEPDDDDDDDDDDDEGVISSGLEKAVTIGGFIVGALIICLLIYFIGKAAGLFPLGGRGESQSTSVSSGAESVASEQVEVPSILGMDEARALEEARKVGLGIKAQGEEPSEEYAAGLITRQDPQPGTAVDKNSTIYYFKSSGSDGVLLPNVVGSQLSEAEETLRDAGFTSIRVEEENDADEEVGIVLAMDPEEGSTVSTSETITLTVSAGPETDETVEIPNYRGMSEDYAREALEDSGLIVQVRRGKTSGIGYGEVIETRPAAGTEVPVGSTVTLIINDPDGDEDAGEDEDEEEDDRPGWTASAKLGEASNYTGGAYRLVLEQTVDGEKVTTELESGDTLTFPHQMEITGAAGVRNGYVVLYEETDSGETVRAQWPVTFTGN